METTCELSFTRTLAAPPEEVFRAFTHATALRDWLSRSAHTQPQVNGYLFLQWPDLSIVQGVYQKFEAPHLLEFSWQPLGDAKPDTVEVHIETVEGGSQLTLVHHLAEDCNSARQVYTAAWASALENLESFLLTGIDLRLARRPRMGIYLDGLDASNGCPAGSAGKRRYFDPGHGSRFRGGTFWTGQRRCTWSAWMASPHLFPASLAPILQNHKGRGSGED